MTRRRPETGYPVDDDDHGALHRATLKRQVEGLDRLVKLGRQIAGALGPEDSQEARRCCRAVRLSEMARDRVLEDLRALDAKRNAALARRLAELPSPSPSRH